MLSLCSLRYRLDMTILIQTLNTALLNSVSEAILNTVIGNLKRTFDRIRITEGHNEAFDEEQKDEARFATIQLEIYILQYLNQSMALVSSESPGNIYFDLRLNVSGSVGGKRQASPRAGLSSSIQ